jgi:hypothetical protein
MAKRLLSHIKPVIEKNLSTLELVLGIFSNIKNNENNLGKSVLYVSQKLLVFLALFSGISMSSENFMTSASTFSPA